MRSSSLRPPRPARRSLAASLLTLALLGVACAPDTSDDEASGADPDASAAPSPGGTADASDGDDALADAGLPGVGELRLGSEFEDFGEDGLDRWEEEVPGIEDLTVTSSADGSQQPTLYLPPTGEEDRPLLVVVHSWSTGYTQHLDIPYARWAQEAGWAFTHPDFRGVNDGPDATGSDLAVQDVADAIEDAVARGGVDPDRVYVTGFSGGGMMALLVASRFPELVAGVVAWVPVEDLNDWYAYNADEQPDEPYADQIEASCGGVPTEDEQAAEECATRSPSTYLEALREAGIPTYLGHGVEDRIVPASHSIRAFDALADDDDRLGEDVEVALGDQEVPGALDGEVEATTQFAADDPRVRHARTSAATTLVLFEGEHDLVFGPTLRFLAEVDADR